MYKATDIIWFFFHFEDIEVYKDVVKLNTKLRKEVKWIIEGI